MSKTIYFVTTNKEKIKQASKSLSRFNIELKDVNLEMPESRAEDSKEIAIEKAKIAFDKLKKPVIVEDSGFYIKSLGGFPMTHIKFSLKTLGIFFVLSLVFVSLLNTVNYVIDVRDPLNIKYTFIYIGYFNMFIFYFLS